MPKNKRKRKAKRSTKNWGEEHVAQALVEVAGGNSIRSTALKYGMSEGLLRRRIKMKDNDEVLKGSGRRTALAPEQEQELAKCINAMCKTGFSPTRVEIKNLVKEYVQLHNLKTPFKDDRPGKDWLRMFMDRNSLSMKKANMISTARLSATANPFIIYDFYELIERVVRSQNLQPNQIWNCDESGFPTDPARCKVVSTKGEVAYKVTWGAGRENISTLDACNAEGRVLDPLIILIMGQIFIQSAPILTLTKCYILDTNTLRGPIKVRLMVN